MSKCHKLVVRSKLIWRDQGEHDNFLGFLDLKVIIVCGVNKLELCFQKMVIRHNWSIW